MINEVETKNYHAHKHTKITFCDGVNVITGASDNGKSSFLRSIVWNITNRPMGDEVINWDCSEKDEVSCLISMPEGSVLKKRREGKVIYELATKDVQRSFEAFKTDIPEEVSILFNFSEFNYQAQHDPYFLLRETPGAVAAKLNDLVGLSIIDTMFKNLNGKATESKRKAEEEAKRAKKLQEEIKELSYIDDVEKDLKKIEILVEKYENKVKIVARLSSLVDTYETATQKIAEYKKITGQEKEVKFLLENVRSYEERQGRLRSLRLFIATLQECEDKTAKGNKIISAEKEMKRLQNNLLEYTEKRNRLLKLSKIVKSLQECKDSIKDENEWLSVKEDFIVLKNKIGIFNSKKNSLIKLRKIILIGADIDKKQDTSQKILTILLSNKKELLKKAGLCPLCKTKLGPKEIERILQT